MSEDQQPDPAWTPEALVNYDAAQARLVSVLDQFSAGLRAAMAERTEGEELAGLREQVDRALFDLDRASVDLTGSYFGAIEAAADDEVEIEFGEADAPEDEAGLGVAVVWRLDVRVDRPSALTAQARSLYREQFEDMPEDELASHTDTVGAALQAVTELSGMDALMSADGVTPLGGLRVFVATEDVLDGGDAIEALFDADTEGPRRWSRELGAPFLPAEGEIGITEGFDFA